MWQSGSLRHPHNDGSESGTNIIRGFSAVRNPEKQKIKSAMFKLFVLTIAFLTIIPAGVWISNTIEQTFETSITQTFNEALESDELLNVDKPENRNIWQTITGAVSDAVDFVGKALNIAKKVLGNYIEAVAVLLVTSCLVPVLVLLLYLILISI